MARKLLVSLVLVFVLTGCDGPRGETKTLSEVLEGSKTRFSRSMQQGIGSEEVGKHLSTLTAAVEALQSEESGGEQARIINEIVSSMDSLMGHAGYMTRPSLAELLKQYQSINELPDDTQASKASIQLLAARTYSLLARELETTRFQL